MATTGTPIQNPYEKYLQPKQTNIDGSSGNGGFNFSLTQSGGGAPPPPAPPSYSGGGYGGGGSSSGLSNAIADGQYKSQYDITDAQNAAMNQSRQAKAQQDLARQQANSQFQLQQAQFNQQNQMRDSILSSMNAVGTWGTNAPPMPRIEMQQIPFQSGAPGVGQIQMPDLSAAQNAAFARAKDREGQMAQGALTGLRSSLGGRGLLGSGAEQRGTANIANRGLANLGEVNREQAIQGASANVDAAKLGYQGAITQRGQDIGQAQGLNSINLQVAQANMAAQQRQQELAMQHNMQQEAFMRDMLLGLVRSY